ncbi:hypothetical protein CBD41_09295 [bacterium TMED181]|nr:hypothetical protein [Planctomycetota bacterium]OUW42262.1 MAG: hypothetical protein CBD41_09295 [bacterium TMED181]
MNPFITLILAIGISTTATPVEEKKSWSLSDQQQKQILELFAANEESITSAGVVTLEYHFEEDDPQNTDNFFPPVSSAPNARLKWPDHHWGYGRSYHNGVVIADSGEWFHQAVWEPAVRMDVDFVSYTTGNASRKDLVAATYAWSKKNRRRVGSNMGTQLVRLSGVRASARQGKSTPFVHEERSRFGFDLKSGTFTTRQMGSSRESSSSKKLLKDLTSGQVGLVWSGGVTGIVEKVRITGRLQLDWIRKHLPDFNPEAVPVQEGSISQQLGQNSRR